ncbi:MAG: hypothetical protein WC974_09325 [Thermoplasmata archaeon]
MEKISLFRFRINGNLEYVKAKTYTTAERKIFRREMKRIGRANITDTQIKTPTGWSRCIIN